MAPDIRFPHIGFELESVNRVAFKIFNIEIFFYSLCIAVGVFFAYKLAMYYGNKDKMHTEEYFDFLFWALITGIIGARIYYIIFSWDSFRGDIIKMLDFRSGGLAIYGGIICPAIMTIFFTKKRNWNFFSFADTVMPGVLVGQIFGRWGNFFNKEAFGGFTDGFLAMQLKTSQVDASIITKELTEHLVTYMNVSYIQVHPTFLYESLWNVGVLLLLHFYRPYKKFEGEIFALYFLGYGLGRFWIEGLRTDQLLLFNTGLPISQLLSAILVIASIGFIIYSRIKEKEKAY